MRLPGKVTENLLQSQEACIRFKTFVNVLGGKPDSPGALRLRHAIPESDRVRALVAGTRGADGGLVHPYRKWNGPHWVLADLADIGYPPGDAGLIPMRAAVYDWLLGPKHQEKIRSLNGRVRRCASQEGNALFYLVKLGLADSRTDELAARLMKWQWPDGGWNCDKRPEAHSSSFMETLIPLRGLALYGRQTGNRGAHDSARRAAEVFLKRDLFRRSTDGHPISEDFIRLHYPCYWHYDVLFGLKVMAEAGYIGDRRCRDALTLLESKRLPDGGFPAEHKYYVVSAKAKSSRSAVDWGGSGIKRMNEFVTVDAMYVLRQRSGEAARRRQ
jgi:hypothetical protein